MATEENPYLKMSKDERERQRNLLKYAEEADGAALDVAAVVAFKWAVNRLIARKKLSGLGPILENVPVQAYPKESNMGKVADLSETQIDNIKKAVTKALESISL